jgi:hypothetical protein
MFYVAGCAAQRRGSGNSWSRLYIKWSSRSKDLMGRTIADFCFRDPNRRTIGRSLLDLFSQEPAADHAGVPALY